MICPFCETQNRDERDSCYHCGKDLSMLRLIVNKAKHHYNLALEHAERGRNQQAMVELQNTLDLDARHVNAHVVLGTIYAREEQFDKAKEEWKTALSLNPSTEKAYNYLGKSEAIEKDLPALQFFRMTSIVLGILFLSTLLWFAWLAKPASNARLLKTAMTNYQTGNWGEALTDLQKMTSQHRGRRREGNMVATSLMHLIDVSIQQRFDSAQMALRSGDYASAFEDLAYLEQKKLQGRDLESIQELKQTANERATAQLDQILTTYRATGEGYPYLRMRLDRIEDAVKAGYLKDLSLESIKKEIAELRQLHESNDLALIRADWTQDNNHATALIRTYQLIQGSGNDSSPETDEFFNRLLEIIREDIQDQTKPLLDSGDYEKALQVEDDLLGIYSQPLRKVILSKIVPVEETIRQVESEKYLDELRQAADQNEYEAFLELAQDSRVENLDVDAVTDLATSVTLYRERLAEQRISEVHELADEYQWDAALATIAKARELALNKEQREDLQDLEDSVRQNRAEAFIEELVKLDARFRVPPARRITKEIAQRVVDEWEDLLKYAPEIDEELLLKLEFYHAVSAFVIGDTEQARELFEDFVEHNGNEYADRAEEYLGLINEASSEDESDE